MYETMVATEHLRILFNKSEQSDQHDFSRVKKKGIYKHRDRVKFLYKSTQYLQ